MTIPDAITPIVGYRAWAVALGRLWSPAAPVRVPWPKGQLRARCLRNRTVDLYGRSTPDTYVHDAPDPACTCGLYAMSEPWEIGPIDVAPPWCLVIGKVHGWGRVLVGRRGWRAECACPVELFAPAPRDAATNATIELVARTYGLPLIGHPVGIHPGAGGC